MTPDPQQDPIPEPEWWQQICPPWWNEDKKEPVKLPELPKAEKPENN